MAKLRFGHVSANPFGIFRRQRKDRPSCRRHLAGLHQTRAHHGIDGRFQFRVGKLLTQQGQLRLGDAQLRLRLRDLFLARSCDCEFQRALVDDDLGVGDVGRGLGDVGFLLARDGSRGQCLAPLELATRIQSLGAGSFELRPRLRDLLGTTAIAEPVDDRLLACDLRFGLSDLRRETACVESGENLAGADEIAFLDENFSDALAAVERQSDLAKLDIAEQNEIVGSAPRVQVPPGSPAEQGRDQKENHDAERSLVHVSQVGPASQFVKLAFEICNFIFGSGSVTEAP